MNTILLDQIADSILYEGHILYPYRASSSRQSHERFTEGRIYPQATCDECDGLNTSSLQTECLLVATHNTATVSVSVRFLQPLKRDIAALRKPVMALSDNEQDFDIVPELVVDKSTYQSWHEAVEREIAVTSLALRTRHRCSTIVPFQFPAVVSRDPIFDEQKQIRGFILRTQAMIAGTIEIKVALLKANLFKLTVRTTNTTPMNKTEAFDQDSIALRTCGSVHTVLNASGAEFISCVDTPSEFKSFASHCKNIGTYPVLLGDAVARERNAMLSAPVNFPDYPGISAAPNSEESQIDETLAFAALTATPEEEYFSPTTTANSNGIDGDGEMTSDDFDPHRRLESVYVGHSHLKAGDRVRIRPKHLGESNIVLNGRTAVIKAFEQDSDNHIHLTVILEDDAIDGETGIHERYHRFLYDLDEVEPLTEAA